MDSKVTLVCTKCGLEKLTEDFNKRNVSKSGFQFKCKDCEKSYKDNNKERISEANKKYNNENKERRAEISKRWFKENKERSTETNKKWRVKNRERSAETTKKWNNENKERRAETDKKWCEENRDKKNVSSSKRRSKKLQACPSWLTKDDEMKIEGLYSKARQMYLDTGIPHHVDHFIPLTHPLVCGFHCFSNLRVITAKENLSKSNKFVSYVESDLDPENPKPWEKPYVSIYNLVEVA